MAKPSIVAAGIVIVLSVGLIAIEAAGLGIFLSEYDDLSVTFVTAAKLVGVFVPFAAIPVSTALTVHERRKQYGYYSWQAAMLYVHVHVGMTSCNKLLLFSARYLRRRQAVVGLQLYF